MSQSQGLQDDSGFDTTDITLQASQETSRITLDTIFEPPEPTIAAATRTQQTPSAHHSVQPNSTEQANRPRSPIMSQTHEDLPTFDPGRDHSAISTKWSRWLEVWELYLASKELDKISDTASDYERTKILKPLFLLKIGEEAREVYNSKRKADKSDKLTDVIKFMSDHYAPKRSVFAYVSMFYKAKRHEGELVSDYVVRLRQLAKPCNFGNSLDNELLRAFVFGCGISKVEELMCSSDSKSLQDAIDCGLKNEHSKDDLKHIRSAYSSEPFETGGVINYAGYSKATASTSGKTCGWCGYEPHDRKNCPAKDEDCKNCGTKGHYSRVCRKTQTKFGGVGEQKKTYLHRNSRTSIFSIKAFNLRFKLKRFQINFI